jgi:16S rRNA (cytidine1402-2'-O)-methyltransferase
LTKRFEQIHSCSLQQALIWLKAAPEHGKGEFVLIVAGKIRDSHDASALDAVLKPLMAALPTKQAVQLAAEITGLGRNALYERSLQLKNTLKNAAEDTNKF